MKEIVEILGSKIKENNWYKIGGIIFYSTDFRFYNSLFRNNFIITNYQKKVSEKGCIKQLT